MADFYREKKEKKNNNKTDYFLCCFSFFLSIFFIFVFQVKIMRSYSLVCKTNIHSHLKSFLHAMLCLWFEKYVHQGFNVLLCFYFIILFIIHLMFLLFLPCFVVLPFEDLKQTIGKCIFPFQSCETNYFLIGNCCRLWIIGFLPATVSKPTIFNPANTPVDL